MHGPYRDAIQEQEARSVVEKEDEINQPNPSVVNLGKM
jgi:hypothetical protein